jgi:metallo-beta-lactamase class B
MKRNLAPWFCTMLLLTISNVANAQGSKAAAEPHLAAAKAAAYEPGNDLTRLYDTVCAPALSDKAPGEPQVQEQAPGSTSLANRKIPPRSEWYTQPAKVFDNLYWIGSTQDSTWAVTTSEGIILIDSGLDYSAKELITDGLKKMGLDPAQIKYLIISHAHSDRYWGAKYIQDTYKAHVIVSEVDWHGIEISPDPNELKPKKDMVATDGMKLTLGDTTLTFYLTPGHTPGAISTLVPLKDGNERHLGAVWGGINPTLYGHGVRNGPTLKDVIKTWAVSAARFQDITKKAGADVYLTIHPYYDKTYPDKLNALNFRKAGGPHPFVNKDNVQRFLTIIEECSLAQLARISS